MNFKKTTGVIILFLMSFACLELRSQLNLKLLDKEVVAGSELIAKMPNGDLCITATRIDNGVEKAFISRCNSTGVPVWTKDLSIGGSPRINDLVIDAGGHAGICGSSILSGSTRSAFVSRFDMNTQTFLLHKTWQSDATIASNIIATASGKEYIVTGSWITSSPTLSSTITPSIFVASVDISGNGSGMSWFKDIYNSLRTTGVGLLGSFYPTALCEMKDGYAVSFYRQQANSKDAWTFLILKNGVLPVNGSGITVFTPMDIDFTRTGTTSLAQGKICNAIGDLNSNMATLFYVTSSSSGSGGYMNPEEGIAAVKVTYNTTGVPATIGDQTFLRLPVSPTVDILRMRSLVYDNNEAYLAGSIGTTSRDAYLVHLNRNTFLFTNAYRLNFGTSQEEMLHICGSVASLYCSYTSNGYGALEKMLLGSLSLTNLGGICQFSADNFDDFDHNNAVNSPTSRWFGQNMTMGNANPPTSPLTIFSEQRCEPCPEPSRTSVSLKYCSSSIVTGAWYKPFAALAPGEKYVVKGIGNSYMYDSEIGLDIFGIHISGAIAHLLPAGVYKFSYYTADGCLSSEITVTVTTSTPYLVSSSSVNKVYCATPGTNGTWVNPCSLLSLPASFMYTLEDLGTTPAFTPYNSDEWAATHGGNGCISHFLGDGSYRVRLYDKSDCSYKELTINVAHTTPTLLMSGTTDFTYCAIPGETGIWFNPCDHMINFDPNTLFTFQDMLLPHQVDYNSEVGYNNNGTQVTGCTPIFVTGGTYKFTYYDKVNCTYNIMYFNISSIAPTVNVCTKYINLGCDDPEPDLGIVLQELDCPDCNRGAGTEPTTWSTSQFGDLPLDVAKVYTRLYLDRQNCSYCEVRVIVQHMLPENASSKIISVTAQCPATQTVNIRSLFLPLVVTGPIYHHDAPWDMEPHSISGDEYAFCCPFPIQTYPTFAAMGPDGCMHQIIVTIQCVEDLMIPDTKSNPGEKAFGTPGMTSGVMNEIKVSPNPSTGIYTLYYHYNDPSVDPAKTYGISVMDVSGKVLYAKQGLMLNSNELLDISQLAAGVYMLMINDEDNVKFVRLIKN